MVLISTSSDVEKINETSQMYHIAAYALILLSFVFLVISVFIWFKMHIRHEILVLTGIGVKREIAKIEKKSMRKTQDISGKASFPIKSTITVPTRKKEMDDEKTVLLENVMNKPLYNKDRSFINKDSSFIVEKDEVYISDTKQ